MDDGPPTRIVLRPIGTPLPLGLAGLAIASFVESGLELGWIARTETAHVGLILLAAPAVLQVLASIFCYLARDGAAGTTMAVLAGTWLAVGLVDLDSRPGEVSAAIGLLMLATGGVLVLTAAVLVQSKVVPAAIVVLAAIRFMLGGIYELSSRAAWQHAAGIAGLVLSGLAAYGVLALGLETQKRRTILPTLRRQRGAAAMQKDAAAQTDGVAQEPGVRQSA